MRRTQKSLKPTEKPLLDAEPTDHPPGPREPTDAEREVYAQFVDRLILSDTDRVELKEKRGLTDATIDACRFSSGGEIARRALDRLRGHVDEDVLVSSGLFERREVGGTGTAEPNRALISGTGIIPYFDDNERCIGIKRHKGPNDNGYWLVGKRV